MLNPLALHQQYAASREASVPILPKPWHRMTTCCIAVDLRRMLTPFGRRTGHSMAVAALTTPNKKGTLQRVLEPTLRSRLCSDSDQTNANRHHPRHVKDIVVFVRGRGDDPSGTGDHRLRGDDAAELKSRM